MRKEKQAAAFLLIVLMSLPIFFELFRGREKARRFVVTAAETIDALQARIDELETEAALFEMTASVQAAKTLDHRQEIALDLLPRLIDDGELHAAKRAFEFADYVLQEGFEKKVVCPMCRRRMGTGEAETVEPGTEDVEPGEDTPEPETDESTGEEPTVNPSE